MSGWRTGFVCFFILLFLTAGSLAVFPPGKVWGAVSPEKTRLAGEALFSPEAQLLNPPVVYADVPGALFTDQLILPKPKPRKAVLLTAAPPEIAPKPVIRLAIVVPGNLDELFKQYGGQYNVDDKLLARIAKCESDFNQVAISGPYGGMYQYLASTWISTRRDMGLDPNPELRFDAREAVLTSAWKIAHGGIDAWPVCGKI